MSVVWQGRRIKTSGVHVGIVKSAWMILILLIEEVDRCMCIVAH